MKDKVKHGMHYTLVAAVTFGLAQLANAAGLGPISVHSHVGEPLNATIRLTGSDVTPGSVHVGLASDQEYAAHGMSKLPIHKTLRFSTSAGNGEGVVRVSSTQPIKKPFVNFLLTADVGGKKITREYAAFPDVSGGAYVSPKAVAPEQTTAAPKPAVPKLLPVKAADSQAKGWQGKEGVKRVSANPAVELIPLKSPERKVQLVPLSNNKPSPVRHTAGKGSYGPVQKGQTLYGIARDIQPSQAYPISKIMRAIFLLNRDAFSSSSLDSLMSGYTLRLPNFSSPDWDKGLQRVAQSAQKKNDALVGKAEETRQEPTADEVDKAALSAEASVEDENLPNGAEESSSQSGSEDGSIYEANAAASGNLASDDAEKDNLQASISDGVPAEAESSASDQSEQMGQDLAASLSDESVQSSTDNVSTDSGGDESVPQDSAIKADTDSSAPSSEQLTSETAERSTNNPAVSDKTVNAQPATAEMSDIDDEQSFLNQTFILLPNWQWLVIFAALLVLLVGLVLRSKGRDDGDILNEEDQAELDDAEMDAIVAKIKSIENGDYDDEGSDEDLHKDDSIDFYDDNHIAASDDDAGLEFVGDDESDALSSHEDESYDSNPALDLESFVFDQENIPEESEKASAQDFDVSDVSEKKEHSAESSDHEEDTLNSGDKKVEKDFNLDDILVDVDMDGIDDSVEEKTSSSSTPNFSDDMDDTEEFIDFTDDDDNHKHKADDTVKKVQDNDFSTFLVDGKESHTSSTHEVKAHDDASEALDLAREMEISLDLATSFVVTGHPERAKKWLHEVMELGNPSQRERAREMLDKLK